MWIIIEDGEVFEGDAEQLADVFGIGIEEVYDFCEREGWRVRVYDRQGESWN